MDAEKSVVRFLFIVFILMWFLTLHIESRYSVPLMPAIIFLTGAGLWKLLSEFSGQTSLK